MDILDVIRGIVRPRQVLVWLTRSPAGSAYRAVIESAAKNTKARRSPTPALAAHQQRLIEARRQREAQRDEPRGTRG